MDRYKTSSNQKVELNPIADVEPAASLLWRDLDLEHDAVLAPAIICSYLVLAPVLAWLAWRHPATRPVLLHGWTPVLFAMLISSAGGLILDNAVVQFSGIAVYQPVMNGVGGNLAAVQVQFHSKQQSFTLQNGKLVPHSFSAHHFSLALV